MQEIFIGRDGTNNTLKVSTNGKSVNGGAISQTVSREHCKLVINDDGSAVLTNLNPRNVTYVNGHPIKSEVISGSDIVELGGDRYRLDLTPFKLAKSTDISHLRKVWDDYKKEQEKYRVSNIRKNALRSITGLFSMAAIVITFIRSEDPDTQVILNTARFVLYGIAIATIVWTVISAFVNAPKTVRKETEMKQRFQDNYVCPNCGAFFGFENRYDMLLRNGQCNRCRTRLKGN